MTALSFTVLGQPIPKARPRVTSRGVYTPESTKGYERSVALSALQARQKVKRAGIAWPLDAEAYELHCVLVCGPGPLPDGDNVFKAIADAISGRKARGGRAARPGVLMDDDKRIAAGSFVRMRGDKPHAVVSVRVLETSARGVGR